MPTQIPKQTKCTTGADQAPNTPPDAVPSRAYVSPWPPVGKLAPDAARVVEETHRQRVDNVIDRQLHGPVQDVVVVKPQADEYGAVEDALREAYARGFRAGVYVAGREVFDAAQAARGGVRGRLVALKDRILRLAE